ncbi:MAG: BatD family protein [candidate division WOR-3 bacterium]|uniref:Protein BatD n=1 Tax=candidate division WOR-3 bacterium TaxID=2052148 RepID=A0A7C1SN91_UNCW3|nr:BatD family protein [candidate division WOR-3 bacterium]
MRRFEVKLRRTDLLILILLVNLVYAGEINFTASVDRTTVGLGEPFELTVTVSGVNISRVPKPQLPELAEFDNLGVSQSQSTSISIINGRVQQQTAISFVYTLVPRKLGELTIGPCRMVYDNTEYTTEPIRITVVKSKTRSQPRTQPQSRFPPGPFDLFEEPEPEPAGADDVFLAASADRTSVYQGEQVTVTWTIYTAQELARLNLKETPALTGFWADDIYQAQELRYEQRTVRGRAYYAAVLRKTALFPTQSGELRVGPMKLEGQIVTGGFFFGRAKPFSVASEQLKITVKPLPESGKPASFTGGVGSFEVSASLSSDRSTGGEPVTLTITVNGTGNLGLITAPALPSVPGLKILTPETKDNFSYAGGRLSGSRRFVYPVLPTADGRYRIPEIELGFFDPKSGSYYVKKTPALEFVASDVPAKSGPVETASPGLRVIGSDIRHIRDRLVRSRGWEQAAGLAVILYPLGFLLLIAGVILGRHQRRLQLDTGYARRSRAFRQARQRLKMAKRALRENRMNEFYGLVRQAVLGFIGDRFNIEAGALTTAELQTELGRFGVDAGLVTELLDTLNLCEIARFSPGAVTCDPPQLLIKAEQLLSRFQTAGGR